MIIILIILFIILISNKKEKFHNLKRNKCCLVENKFIPEEGGIFKYQTTELTGNDCDIEKYRLDNNKQIVSKCNNLGSCRNNNKECIDFVTNEYCNKYNMKWSNKTCRDNLSYQWIDKDIRPQTILPEEQTVFKFFDKTLTKEEAKIKEEENIKYEQSLNEIKERTQRILEEQLKQINPDYKLTDMKIKSELKSVIDLPKEQVFKTIIKPKEEYPNFTEKKIEFNGFTFGEILYEEL